MKNKAIKVTPILGEQERYFYSQSSACDAFGWEVKQFRNHKHKQKKKNKERKYVYKLHVIETIIIE